MIPLAYILCLRSVLLAQPTEDTYGFFMDNATMFRYGSSAIVSTSDQGSRSLAHAKPSDNYTWSQFVEGVTTVGPRHQPGEIKYIIVAANMRSGSTSLAAALAAKQSCVINCNEFFNSRVSERCMMKNAGAFHKRRYEPLLALEKVYKKTCVGRCKSSCIVVFKLFHDHLKARLATQVLLLKNASVIVLERDPRDQYCSLRWAQKTGDWGIKPRENASKRRPPCNRTATPRNFLKAHKTWYALLRFARPRIEVPFVEEIADTHAVVKEILNFSGWA